LSEAANELPTSLALEGLDWGVRQIDANRRGNRIGKESLIGAAVYERVEQLRV
jgi:hypothetical protein